MLSPSTTEATRSVFGSKAILNREGFGTLPFTRHGTSSNVLAPYAERAAVVVPGHGRVGTDAAARLGTDRRYLEDMVRSGASDDPRTRLPAMADDHAHMEALAEEHRAGLRSPHVPQHPRPPQLRTADDR